MENSKRLSQILEFFKVIENLKLEYRASYLSDQSRNESVAEHTWHMSVLALLLHQEIAISINIAHTIELILIHDLVEVYAGDTFAYDFEGCFSKKDRENSAAEKLFSLLPKDLNEQFTARWQEFELAQTPEAKFANAMDKLQAFSQSVFSSGRVWKEKLVTEEMSRARNKSSMELDSNLNNLFEILYEQVKNKRLWHSEEYQSIRLVNDEINKE